MGLFADDKAQDARLDALEQHLRALTETVHRMQIDFADLRIDLTVVGPELPLALGIGEGADAQAPMARAVIGGLTASTLITLVLIPAVYSLFHPRRKRPAG